MGFLIFITIFVILFSIVYVASAVILFWGFVALMAVFSVLFFISELTINFGETDNSQEKDI